MPNADVHILAGIFAPILILIIYLALGYNLPETSIGESALIAVAGILAGFLGAVTPDSIEKPTSPYHRGFFHWVVGFVFAIYLIMFFVTAPNLPIFDFVSYEYFGGFVVISYISGYVSHFILDFLTVL